MHFLIKAPILAQRRTNILRTNLDVEPSANYPLTAVAAIFHDKKNGRQRTPKSYIKFAVDGFSECLLNVLNQDMSNIISDSGNPLHPAAARLEPLGLHDQLDDARNEQRKFANWFQQKRQFLYCQLYCTATGAEGPGVRALSAPSVVCHVRGCLQRTSSVVPCPGSHQLLALDSCASVRHGETADDTLNSSGILSWEFHGPEDEQAVLRHPRRIRPTSRTTQPLKETEVQ